MIKNYAYIGMASMFAIIGCNREDQVSSPIEKTPSIKENPGFIKEDPRFSLSSPNPETPPPAYFENTIPEVQLLESPGSNALPKSEIYLGWAPVNVATGATASANDVAIGWCFYYVDKATLKLYRGYRNWDVTPATENAVSHWEVIAGPGGRSFKRISAARIAGTHFAASYNDHLVAITSDGKTWKWSNNREWIELTGGTSGSDIAVNATGDIKYLGPSNNLYAWVSQSNQWYGIVGQAGLRLSVTETGAAMLVATGQNTLYFVYWDPVTQRYVGQYMVATTVNDVCGGSFYPGGGWDALAMLSANGNSYKQTHGGPNYTWGKIGGDFNTRNISCANGPSTPYVTEFQTNNDGLMYWRDIVP